MRLFSLRLRDWFEITLRFISCLCSPLVTRTTDAALFFGQIKRLAAATETRLRSRMQAFVRAALAHVDYMAGHFALPQSARVRFFA